MFGKKQITEVQWRLFEVEYYKQHGTGRQSFKPDIRQASIWSYGSTGINTYHRDPVTGKIIWDDKPLEMMFQKRADLSTQVWKAVEDQEQMIFDVVRGGRAAGRNVKEIAKDLETFINYKDGGKRVVGRWGGDVPKNRKRD